MWQIFAYWAIVYFLRCFENYRNSPNFLAIFSNTQSEALILTKMGWDQSDQIGRIFAYWVTVNFRKFL
jgi:hypothetical protein